MDYIKLWFEYSTLVRDFQNVFEFMIHDLSFSHYRIFISYSKESEQLLRDFKFCLSIFETGIERNPSEVILAKQLEMFRERMVQRFKRDVIDELSPDTFMEEFGVKAAMYMSDAEAARGSQSTRKMVQDYYLGIQIVKSENPGY